MKAWSDYGIEVKPGATGEYYTTCPQCSPTRKKKNIKCLSVNIEKEVFICHHCDWRGTLKSGVDEKSNPYKWRPKYNKPDYRITDLPAHVVKWFGDRGIMESVLKRNNIGYGSVYMPQLEDFTTAIRFPFYRSGEVVNVKSRDGQKNFRLESGAERIFYGLDDADEFTIIVEGEIDKLSIEQAGYKNCFSVPDGAPSPKAKDYSSKFEFLENCEEELKKIATFVIAVDNDEPGRVLQEELARRLGKERCRLVDWPEGCKDANEVLVKHGAIALQDCIKTSTHYPVQGIYEFKDLSAQIQRLYENDVEHGELTGWKCIDELYTVRPGEWTLVTGIPGHGKSEFIDALLVNLMWKKWRFAVFSPENQPLERHCAKIIEKAMERPFFKGPSPRVTPDELKKAQGLLNDFFTFLLPEEEDLTIEGVLNLAKTVVLRKGIKGLVIDPWNELDHTRPGNITETEYISKSLTTIRRFARAYGVHIWLVAHPAKMPRVKDEKGGFTYPVPTPYDVSGSAHWRNKADNCITVYRNFENEEVDIHVQKIRFKEIGKVGVASLTYDKVTGKYFGKEEPCPY